jgi:hypothetical protein
VKRPLDELARSLTPLLRALQAEVGAEAAAAAEGALGASGVVAAEPRADLAAPRGVGDWLLRFRELLREGDLEARDLWEARKTELAGELSPHTLKRISVALENYEFDLVIALLAERTT